MSQIISRIYSWKDVEAVFGPNGTIVKSRSEAWDPWRKRIYRALDNDSANFPRSYSISGGIDTGNLSGSFLNIPLEDLPPALSAGDFLPERESTEGEDKFSQVTVFFVRTSPAHVVIGIGPPPDLFANGLDNFVGGFWPLS